MAPTQEEYASWIGHNVVDASGAKVGKVADVFVDDETGAFNWISVNTGMFAKKSSFVPMEGAQADGDDLVIAWDKATVKDAPQVDDDEDGHVTQDQENELYRYYKLQAQAASGDTGERMEQGSDDAMTRSEEELHVGTRTTETGRVRLRKYVVTEQVTQTVPVSHEEIRLEREPITDANRDAAMKGAEITEAEHEVILHEERPVVEKEVVPVERVRLATETVAGEETVSEEVRKERIEEVDEDSKR
jgi:uncharacterized protein (TIGR02271 family)